MRDSKFKNSNVHMDHTLTRNGIGVIGPEPTLPTLVKNDFSSIKKNIFDNLVGCVAGVHLKSRKSCKLFPSFPFLLGLALELYSFVLVSFRGLFVFGYSFMSFFHGFPLFLFLSFLGMCCKLFIDTVYVGY